MKNIIKILFVNAVFCFLSLPLWATVITVTTTAAPRSSVGGVSYYLPNQNYTFRVQATSNNTLKSDWNTIQLQIRDATSTSRHSVTISVDADTLSASSNLELVGVVDNSIYATGALDYQITVRIPWSSITEIVVANSNVNAIVIDDSPSTVADVDDPAVNFGTCASLKVMNFAQNGNAADGKVNRLHDTFDVTGVLVYNVASATVLDVVPAGEIAMVTLLQDAVPTAITDTSSSYTLTVPDDYFNTEGLNSYLWGVRVTMAAGAGGGTEATTQTLSIRCDRVRITNMEIFDGGGIDATAPTYFRSRVVPLTKIRVYAAMEQGGGAVEGNTVVRIRYNYNDGTGDHDTDVTILSGALFGEASITYPVEGGVLAANDTLLPAEYTINYRGQEIIGGPYDETNAGNGQHLNTTIAQDATPILVYWDNADQPGTHVGDFTAGFDSTAQAAASISLAWTALAAVKDNDFYTYRIYYKQNSSATWLVLDRNTAPVGTYGILGTRTTTSFTVTGLAPFTPYNFRLSALDVFGNEVLSANRPLINYSTQPATVDVIVSDGITQHENSSFDGDPDPAVAHPVRSTAIKITAFVVTGGNKPDSVNLILANNASDVGADYGSGATNSIMDVALMDGVDRFRIACVYVGPNTWVGYIPNTHALITAGTACRFILEVIYGGFPTYVDHNSEDIIPNFTDQEWRFWVNTTQPNFQPWPTRILNNVINDANPVAYPAYYLSHDAYVTIKVYDIKGRPVTTLMDRAFRKGGQNIKDQGWRGTNKAQKRLGPGLYYIHIQAKRDDNGKIILNKMEKVVIAR